MQAGSSLGWKLYFFLALVAWVLTLFGMEDPLDGALAILIGIGLLPLWGYAFGTRIGWRALWVGYFWLSCAAFAYDLLRGVALGVAGGGVVWVIVLLAGLFAAAGLVATWRYAYRCPSIWQSGGAAAA
jgi:hypothetical protein